MRTADIDTPALLLDLDGLERNIARMRDMTEGTGIRCRPHSKTHKSPVIARMQTEAGAVGICCAKLGEAEVMAAAGVDNMLITSPVVGESKIGRLLHVRGSARVAVVADHPANVAMLGAMARAAGVVLDVVVEVDVGQGRCGVRPGPEAAALARAVAGHPSLAFAGLQGYQGRIQMVEGVRERAAAADRSLDLLDRAAAAVEAAGLAVPVRTGGGTGTAPFDLGRGSLTEIQPGSYVCMDSRYGAIGWPGGGAPPFEQALHVLAGVVSTPAPDRVVVDAGLKAVSSDHGPPRVVGPEAAVFEFGGDEHGIVRMADGGEVPLALGGRLLLVPSHCDTTVNLHDRFVVVRGGAVVDAWPVMGRGRLH